MSGKNNHSYSFLINSYPLLINSYPLLINSYPLLINSSNVSLSVSCPRFSSTLHCAGFVNGLWLSPMCMKMMKKMPSHVMYMADYDELMAALNSGKVGAKEHHSSYSVLLLFKLCFFDRSGCAQYTIYYVSILFTVFLH